MIVRYNLRQVRVVLLAVAGLLALCAIYLKVAEVLPAEPVYEVSAEFRSEFLASTLSLPAVRSVVVSSDFQRAAGARIGVTGVAHDPTRFRLSADDLEHKRAELGFEHALELLRIKMRALALAEVDASKSYLEELKREAKIGLAKREASAAKLVEASSLAPEKAIVSEVEQERAVRLRHEVAGLEAFLRYQARPEWFDARVGSEALRTAQRGVEAAKIELLRLREIFTEDSVTVQAQTKILKRKRERLAGLEKHLARTLLKSHRVSLSELEAKSLSAIKQQSATEADGEIASSSTPSPSDDWLDRHTKALTDQARTLEARATLRQVSDPVVGLRYPMGYWLSLGLWSGSLVLLVWALFLRPRRLGKGGVRANVSASRPGLDRGVDALPAQIASLIRSEAGRLPSRLLVLSQHGDERSALSLRLAQGLVSGGGGSRLVDFDLRSRPLSTRLGDSNSPGVGDLLVYSGLVEEFFASVPGTSIQFAPAGTFQRLEDQIAPDGLDRLFPRDGHQLTVVDASFDSPLHFLIGRVDAAICLYRPGVPWTAAQSRALEGLRGSGLPIWGVNLGSAEVSRFL